CAGDAATEKSEAQCVRQSCVRSRTRIDPATAIRCPFRPVLLSAFGVRRAQEPTHVRTPERNGWMRERMRCRSGPIGRPAANGPQKIKLSLPAICRRVSDRNQKSLTDVQAYLQAYLERPTCTCPFSPRRLVQPTRW